MTYDNTPAEVLQIEDYYVRASTGKRFLNYVIDLIAYYFILIFLGILLGLIYPEGLAFLDNDSTLFSIMDRIISLVLYALFMGLLETLFKGKSFGKFITRTRAVNLDGSPISAKTAFLRGFSRAVPFAPFSAFGNPSNPWQDRWTDTMVVDDIK